MEKISAKKVLYIKLGRQGKWERDCIEKGYLKVGYREVEHLDCLNGKWDRIDDVYKGIKKDAGTATAFKHELQYFYEEPEDTMWITFYGLKMWWCFAKQDVSLQKDENDPIENNTKIRWVKDKWHDTDISGNIVLHEDMISGELLKAKAYRKTILELKIPNAEYVLRKINNERLPEVLEVEDGLKNLKEKLKPLIQKLHWQDFEILIDIIFRHSGWQRISSVGGQNKTLDLDLISPITNERAMVQIKSDSNIAEFNKYVEQFKSSKNEYVKYFYVVHHDREFIDYKNTSNVNLILLDKITEHTINAGLIEWVIKKAS